MELPEGSGGDAALAGPQALGPNQWLIDEMYRRYRDNPKSVSEAWRDFFADYRPDGRAEEALTPEDLDLGTAQKVAPAKAPEGAREAEGPPRQGEWPARQVEGPPRPEREERVVPLRGADATLARRMEESLRVPTATSVRTVPAKLLEVNRNIINRYLTRSRGGKVSFTHLIGYAVLHALKKNPAINTTYREVEGKPTSVRHERVNLGLAVDVRRKDGTRGLVVPNIKAADALDFESFFSSYEALIRKVHSGELGPDDFAGTTITITNPGMIGTVQSSPRLMAGQAAILGVGSIAYPAEFQAADPETLAQMGVSKVVTLTSTYDHRVIQGAESGEFLAAIHRLLIGEEAFYDEIFRSLHVPYVPARWLPDYNPHPDSIEDHQKHGRVLQLINMYRVRGHLIADLDPLETKAPTLHPELDPTNFGLSIWDLDRTFITGGLAGRAEMTLGDILGVLRDAYCRTSTVEYMHISDPDQKTWIQQGVEGVTPGISPEDQRHILKRLNEAEAFETFMGQKYVGHKRFSLEGAESLIPMLDAILESATLEDVAETVIGMSHRGRLNVLANIVGKSYAQIFREFEGYVDPEAPQGSGDVKYHVGAKGKFASRDGDTIVVEVASNPSHLESVDPVVEGMARAKQDRLASEDGRMILPILIHGDAAFAGQGVVAETLNLSQLAGYETGGTIHIIVNNQLGFTTGSHYGRSSTYASDVAKMVQAPIFHVNGDDPEACVRVARLAFEFRREFRKDVVIDMWCYRRWGHNEADEPAFTQPLMYSAIRDRRSVRKLYTERLVNRGDLALDEAEKALEEFRRGLQEVFDQTRSSEPTTPKRRREKSPKATSIATAVSRPVLDEVVSAITRVPDGFNAHPKLAKWLQERAKALDADAVDWSLAEALAFGTILAEGSTIRLAGQDTRRGTFSQRHSVLVDQRTGEEYTPLASLEKEGSRFGVCDSLLSEFAALGFEYGYSIADPAALVLWEGQFGDFVNGAQVVIDQFIAPGEEKWGQRSGLVMLLPHGYEGQGPEHSSARLERFLQLAAERNMRIAVPSTPAQYFHLLRRQSLDEDRKPLVIMTPKSLLRLPAARSAAREFTEGSFRSVIADPAVSEGDEVERLVFCQGKFYYDLMQQREGEKRQGPGAALIRIEELYPFPDHEITRWIERHPQAKVLWAQEEPENMGAWWYLHMEFERRLGVRLEVAARGESPSPATGSYTTHQMEQKELLERVFGPSAAG